jgi:hypothetical protein
MPKDDHSRILGIETSKIAITIKIIENGFKIVSSKE